MRAHTREGAYFIRQIFRIRACAQRKGENDRAEHLVRPLCALVLPVRSSIKNDADIEKNI